MAVNSTFHLRAKVKGNKDLGCSMHTESRSENESPLCMYAFICILINWMGSWEFLYMVKLGNRNLGLLLSFMCILFQCTGIMANDLGLYKANIHSDLLRISWVGLQWPWLCQTHEIPDSYSSINCEFSKISCVDIFTQKPAFLFEIKNLPNWVIWGLLRDIQLSKTVIIFQQIFLPNHYCFATS